MYNKLALLPMFVNHVSWILAQQMAKQIDTVQRVMRDLEGSATNRIVVQRGGKDLDEEPAPAPQQAQQVPTQPRLTSEEMALKEQEERKDAVKANWLKVGRLGVGADLGWLTERETACPTPCVSSGMGTRSLQGRVQTGAVLAAAGVRGAGCWPAARGTLWAKAHAAVYVVGRRIELLPCVLDTSLLRCVGCLQAAAMAQGRFVKQEEVKKEVKTATHGYFGAPRAAQ